MPVTVKGLDDIIKKLDGLNKPGVFKKPMTQSVNHLHNKVAKAPRKAQGAFSAMATEKQRLAYWARVSSGEITHIDGVGYRREGSAKKWNTKITNNGRRGEIGLSGVPWGVYVWGERQQPFHAASGWPRIDKLVETERGTILGFFEAAYKRHLAK